MAIEKTTDQAEFLYQTIASLKVHLLRRLKHRSDSGVCELTLPQSNAMLTIRQHGTMKIRQLSEALGVAPPSASTMVDRLVGMGMLRRETSPDDRRAVNVCVTEAGENRLTEMEAVMLGLFAELLEFLGPPLAEQWLDVYGKIRMWMAQEDRILNGEKDGAMEMRTHG